MNPTITFECAGERAAVLAQRTLERHGLHVVRSFDLSAADSDACGCRHHGSSRCQCQYSVLLVYPPSGAPVVVTAHGHEHRTRLELAANPNAPLPARLVDQVLAILTEASRSGEPAPAETDAAAA